MPIKIFHDDETNEQVAWLCDSQWRLPEQIEALVAWLHENAEAPFPAGLVADLGFNPRDDAGGGSVVLPTEAMEIMIKLKMELHLSEYPPFREEEDA